MGGETIAEDEKIPLLPRVKVSQDEQEHRLDRSLSTLNGVSIMLGILIGSGVFISPGLVVKRTPNLFMALLVWIICGLVIIALMSVAIELGSLFPRPGSLYVYIQKTLGRIPAFMFLWSYSTIIAPSGISVLLDTLGRYATQPFLPATDSIWISKTIGALVCVILCITNSFGIKFIAKLQYVFTGIQILIILLVVAMGIWQVSLTGNFSNFEPGYFFNNTEQILNPANLGEIGKAMYNALWAYDGWILISSLTEEFINPERSLPIVAFTSSIFTLLVYIVLNMAYFAVLTREQMGATNAIGIALVEKVAGKKVALIMPILVASSILGCVNAVIIGLSRTYLSAARDGSMPAMFTLIHREHKSPVPIIWYMCFSTLLWLFAVKTTEDLIQYFNSGYWVFYGMAMLGCLVYKFTAKDVHRPYKTFVITPALLSILALAIVISGLIGQPLGTAMCWLWILSSLIVYYVFIHKQFLLCKCLEKIYDFLQRRCNMVPCQ